jgi:hypothetical protein
MHRAKYYAIIKNIVQVYKMSWSVGRYNKLENWKLLLLLASKGIYLVKWNYVLRISHIDESIAHIAFVLKKEYTSHLSVPRNSARILNLTLRQK